jgi:hypothetical protein
MNNAPSNRDSPLSKPAEGTKRSIVLAKRNVYAHEMHLGHVTTTLSERGHAEHSHVMGCLSHAAALALIRASRERETFPSQEGNAPKADMTMITKWETFPSTMSLNENCFHDHLMSGTCARVVLTAVH